MADNVPVTPTTSYTVAADDIGGVHHQRVKVGFGPDGSYADVTPSTQLPISGTVQVSGAVAVSGTVTAGGTVTVATGTVNLNIDVTTAVPGATGTGAVVWVANSSAQVSGTVTVAGTVTVIAPAVSTIVTILGTQVVSVVPGLSVSAVVSGTVTAGGTVSANLLGTTATQAAVSAPVVWLAPTQTVSLVSTIVTILGTQIVSVVPGLSVSAVVSGTVTVGAANVTVVSTIVTILGTQIVTVAGGTTVVSGTVTAINSGILFTIGQPTQASTAQIVVAKQAPLQHVQIAVTSTAIAQSANKYVFTIWTGLTGAPAAAGTTSWAVPAGQVLRLSVLQAALTSSAVLGGSVQFFVGVGATASMISASIPTQLQLLKLSLFGDAALQRAQLGPVVADVTAGESIAVFIVASTAAVLRDLVIAGNLF